MKRLSWFEYLALDAINWSRLKHIDESPAHYRARMDEENETAPQTLGRYVHAAVLDPEHLRADFAIWDGDRRGGEYKAFAAANAGKTIMRAADVRGADGMIAALKANADVRALLDGAVCEHTIEWTDPTTGLRCKARPDLVRPADRVLADLKTTRSTEIRRFGSDIARFLYHGQMAHYAAGLETACGWEPARICLIAVESSPPYDVAVFDLDPMPVKIGRDLRDTLLARLAECRASDNWPGRYDGPVLLDQSNLPDWVFGGSPADDISGSEGEF